jgi:hypothetical protein
MTDRITLLEAENIIHVDAHGIEGTIAEVDEIIGTVERLAVLRKEKPYVVTNWSGSSIQASAVEHYKQHIRKLVPLVRAIVRYGVTESSSRVLVRTTAVLTGGGPSAASNIFETKEQAFAAIRAGRVG